MTDEEVQDWLSDEERAQFREIRVWPDYGGALAVEARDVALVRQQRIKAALRSLAETRKALGRVEGYAYDRISECCVLCGYSYPPHSPTCIFATMPRPR